MGKIKELENSKTEMAVIGCVINDISMLDDASIYIPTQDVWSDNRCRVLWNKVRDGFRRYSKRGKLR